MLTTTMPSPIGEIILTANTEGLTGVYFQGQAHFPELASQHWTPDPGFPHLTAGKAALVAYFAHQPFAMPKLHFASGTEFQRSVWAELLEIPAGETRTYGEIASKVGRPAASRAVGAAVGRNPISLLVPCHRVLGKNGTLTGYAGGMERKAWLLEREHACSISLYQ